MQAPRFVGPDILRLNHYASVGIASLYPVSLAGVLRVADVHGVAVDGHLGLRRQFLVLPRGVIKAVRLGCEPLGQCSQVVRAWHHRQLADACAKESASPEHNAQQGLWVAERLALGPLLPEHAFAVGEIDIGVYRAVFLHVGQNLGRAAVVAHSHPHHVNHVALVIVYRLRRMGHVAPVAHWLELEVGVRAVARYGVQHIQVAVGTLYV